MATGVAVDPSVVDAVMEVNNRKLGFRYAIFKINDEKTKVVLDKKGESKDGETWSDFCNEFHDDQCRYAVYMVPIVFNSVKDDRPLTMFWNGPSSGIKTRMLYAGTLGSWKNSIKQQQCAEIADRSDLNNIDWICSDKMKGVKFAGEK